MLDDWREGTLGELAHVEMGQSPPSEHISDLAGNGTAFLQGNAEFTDLHPRPRLWCRKPAKQAQPGDALISVRAPVGALNRADIAYCIGRGLAAIRFREIDPDFGYHSLAHTSAALSKVAQGSTFGAVGGSELRSLGLQIPPLPEQRRIATILDTLDEAIRRTEQVIEKLKQMKQGLLHDLLTRGIDDNGELRPPPDEAPHLYKDSPVGRIPRGWDAQFLGEIVSFRGGFGFPDRFQGLSSGDLPFFKVSDQSNEGNERYLIVANHYVSRTTASRQGWHSMPAGGVAFAKVGAALLLNRRRILVTDSLVDNNMMVAVASDIVDSIWLYWFLVSVDFSFFVQPGALPSVNQGQLGSLPIALPTVEEQRAIRTVLDWHDARVDDEVRGLSKLRTLKHGLMDDLLTGRVRVATETS